MRKECGHDKIFVQRKGITCIKFVKYFEYLQLHVFLFKRKLSRKHYWRSKNEVKRQSKKQWKGQERNWWNILKSRKGWVTSGYWVSLHAVRNRWSLLILKPVLKCTRKENQELCLQICHSFFQTICYYDIFRHVYL